MGTAGQRCGLGCSGGADLPQIGDPTCEIDSLLSPRPGERILCRNTCGLSGSREFDRLLRVFGIESVVVVGVMTDACAFQTSREELVDFKS